MSNKIKMLAEQTIEAYRTIIAEIDSVSDEEAAQWSHQKTFDEHRFYLELVPSLHPLFPDLAPERVQLINLACISFLRGLIGFDKVIDEGAHEKFKLGLINYELAIKLTTSMFPPEHEFWQGFNKVQAEYFCALDTEMSLSSRGGISAEQFELLSQQKSSYVKLAVSLLCHSSGNFECQPMLNDALMSFHIALQYIDDLKDFKADIRQQQFTHIYFATLDVLRQAEIPTQEVTPDVLYKYMILSGVAEGHCDLALEHLAQSLQALERFDVPGLTGMINEEVVHTQKTMWMLQQTVARHKLHSNIEKVALAELPSLEVPIHNAIKTASAFVLNQCGKDHFWYSFLTDNGKGQLWVSCFIAYHLMQAGVEDRRLAKAIEVLLNVAPTHFSFNFSTPQDADSSSFFILLHALSGAELPEPWLNSWLAFAKSDGSWGTYLPGKVIPTEQGKKLDASGWHASHLCVSSVAVLVLAKHLDSDLAWRGAEYLLREQGKCGAWSSYWWSSDVYATSYSIQALTHLSAGEPRLETAVEQGCQWLVQQQSEAGHWQDAFYTALAVRALMPYSRYADAVENGIKWLLSEQLIDGSWLTSDVLRVPHPSVTEPNQIEQWTSAPYGYNTLTYDDNRSFTASLVLGVLADWSKVKRDELKREHHS